MTVGLVIPAHGRLDVSRLAFRGIAWLVSVLAVRGITARVLVLADDQNLELAEAVGFEAVYAPNVLGDRVNDGFERLAADSDWLCFTGSDNWLHPDLLDACSPPGCEVYALEDDRVGPNPPVLTGRRMTMVDLETGRATLLSGGANRGMPPWIIPTKELEHCSYRPIPDGAQNGMEGHLTRALLNAKWREVDTSPAARVDFKTADNMSSYRMLRQYGHLECEAWGLLADEYPAELVDMARETLAVAA